jgi:hypothetical protein
LLLILLINEVEMKGWWGRCIHEFYNSDFIYNK